MLAGSVSTWELSNSSLCVQDVSYAFHEGPITKVLTKTVQAG